MSYIVREMEEADISQVAQVEREAFPTQGPGAPFRKELQNRLARYLVAGESLTGGPKHSSSNDNHAAAPSESSQGQPLLTRWFSGIKQVFSAPQERDAPRESILGFVGVWFMVDEAHITSIGVRESSKRRGIGEALLISAIDLVVRRNCRTVSLEVRVSNMAAQALYEKYGFARVGIRKGYYTDNHEDAYVMSTDVITSPAYQSQFQRLKEAHKAKWGESLRIPCLNVHTHGA